MARVFKPTFTKTDPATGEKRTKTLRKWYVEYRDADGRVRRVPGYADRKATDQLAADLERRAARQQVGMIDPSVEHSRRPLAEHLADYRRALQSRGNDARYISQAVAHCQAVFAGIAAVRPSDLDADKVANWLAELRRGGVGPVTSNHYLRSVRGFAGWMFKSGRAAADPLKRLSGVNGKLDVRRRRRDMALDECGRLLRAAAASGRVFRGLSGEVRRMLYLTALETGFRAAELASLYPGSFDLDADPPTATVEAAYAKNGQEAVQPLPLELARALRPFLAGLPSDRPVWPGTWAKVAFKMIGRDLAAARAAWIAEAAADADESQRRELSDFLAYHADAGTVDFHSLRHSYISSLARSGVHPKTAQVLARHSTIGLTMDLYTHVRLHDQAAALEALPSLLPSAPAGAGELRATGTESATGGVPHVVQHVGLSDMRPHSDASAGIGEGTGGRKGDRRKGLENKPLGTASHQEASGRIRVGEGTRTPDIQSHSLTL